MADKIIENNQVSVMGHDGYPGKTSQRFGGQDPGDGV